MPQIPSLIGTREAAARLNVSDETVRRWIAQGLLEAVRLPSGTIRIRAAEIDALVNPKPVEA